MTRSLINISLFAAVSLLFAVLWPGGASAVPAPKFERLGQLKDGLRVPAQLDLDAAGNLYVADSRLKQVVKFDRFGRIVTRFTTIEATGAGLAASSDGSRIYVAAEDKVAVYAATGELVGYLGKGSEEFGAAGPIDLDSDGNIYVADLTRRQIKVYSPDLANSGTLGEVTFVAGSDLVIDPNSDQIYIADSATVENSGLVPQVRIYDRLGNPLRSIGAEAGFGESPLLFFGGMTFDQAGRFYVGDVAGKSVRVLDASGTVLLNYAEHSISRPSSLAYDQLTGRLFVLRSDRQVDIYGINGGTNPQQLNSAPQVPQPKAPIGGSEVSTLTPELSFANAVDADEVDEISYTLRLFDADQQLVANFDVSEQPNLSVAVVPVALQEDGYYSWQVQAFDGQLVSAWSDLQSFYVNATNLAPTAPQLLSPLAGTAVSSFDLLSWKASKDSDPVDLVDYRVEIATDAGFETLVVSQQSNGTGLPVAAINTELEPGSSYFWRVIAVDNHAASSTSKEDGRFSYQASALQVTANMPDARVYLGGQQNYAGQFVGEAPLVLRDLQPGRYQVVVERAGFEPYLSLVEVSADAVSELSARLQPALQPAGLSFAPLPVAGQQLNSTAVLTPLLADLDQDGIEDLLLTSADGGSHYYPGVLRNAENGQRQVDFVAEQTLELPQLLGAAICLIDWNNDFQQDLLIGAADGSVLLYLNQGDLRFEKEGQLLTGVLGQAVPTVADIDQDGDKDLVVGSAAGELVLLLNIGSDAAPQLAAPQLLVTFAEAAAPTFADWDGDGRRELLIAAEGQVYRAELDHAALSGLGLIEIAGAQVERLAALDLDAVGGKDLIVGTADGRLLIAAGRGEEYVAAFFPALEAKLLQIKTELADEHPVQLPLVDLMSSSLAEKKLVDLQFLSEELAFRLPADASAALLASELAAILQSSGELNK